MRRAGFRGDEGVSVVIGAVLLLAILVAALISFRLAYVPVAGERAEHDHMKEVSSAMASLNAQILESAQEDDGAPFPTGIPMSGTYPPLVPGTSPGGTLELAGERSVRLDADALTFLTRGGAPVVGDDWTPVEGTNTTSNIDEVRSLRVSLLTSIGTGEGFNVRLEDADGAQAGRFLVQETGSDRVDLRVFDAAGTRVYFERIYNQTSDFQDQHRFNLLADTYGFDVILDQAEGPFNVTFEEIGSVDIEYNIVYEETTGGLSRLTGHGDTVTGYGESFQTGTLSFATAYQFFVRQTLVLDHGAMIMEQNDGAVFTIEPPLRVEATDTLSTVHLLAPSITGDGFSISSGDRVEVHTTPDTTQRFHASANNLTLTFTTTFQDQWEAYLEEAFQDAFSGVTPQQDPPYQVEQVGANEVQATLFGPQGPTDHDIALTFIQGDVQTEVTR